jgi:hypothetical protein
MLKACLRPLHHCDPKKKKKKKKKIAAHLSEIRFDPKILNLGDLPIPYAIVSVHPKPI